MLSMPKEDYYSVKKFLENDDDPTCAAELLEQMAYGHMIIPDGKDEVAVLADLYNVSRHNTSQLSLTLVTSLGCNFDCPYCYEVKHPSIMDEHVKRAILKLLDDQITNKKIKSFHVSWFGGEPLLGKKPLLSLA
jgi:uncharacterized protein